MAPAGEIWSVVTLSPTFTKQRAPAMGAVSLGSTGMSTKKGGSWM